MKGTAKTGRGLALAATLLLLLPGCAVVQQLVTRTPKAVEEGKCAFGTFRRVEGVGVLTLWGPPYQRGFAHGCLMAPAVLEMVDVLCGSDLLLSNRKDYERVILPLVESFRFEQDDEAELRGILDGVRAQLGASAVLKQIGRPLELKDLKAYNTAGDWYRQACSSFAAWGSRTRDGHVWVGRNFDFLPAKAFFPHQMIIVHQRAGAKRAWATASAPGMIGCVTGINDAGVFTAVHDVYLPLRPIEGTYVPRLLVLRRLMETCTARDLAAQALPILEARRQMFDNAILLAAPVRDGTPPAIVLEYDGDFAKAKGVTVRTPADNEKGLDPEFLTCTNHFRKRAKPGLHVLDYRQFLLRRVLTAKTAHGEKVGLDIAQKAMGAVRLPITVYSVVADLDTLDFWFARGEFLTPPHARDYVQLPMKRWLATP